MSDKPATGEWTVKFDNMIYERETFVTLITDRESRERVISMHNTALTAVAGQVGAERHRCEKLMTDGISERNWSNHLRIQLAAEVEKVNKLQEQLAAEREKAEYNLELYERCVAKLDAERHNRETCEAVEEGTAPKPVQVNAEASGGRSNSGDIKTAAEFESYLIESFGETWERSGVMEAHKAALGAERHKREACEVLIRDLQKELAMVKDV